MSKRGKSATSKKLKQAEDAALVERDEIELKLRLHPEHVERFRRLALLRSLASARPVTTRLITTYFDTPDLALRENKIALRVREQDDKRIQGIKIPAKAGDGLQRCREIETEVESPEPDLRRLAGKKMPSALRKVAKKASALDPLFTTDLRRRTQNLSMDGSEIELALDIGELRAGDHTEPICEVELELKSGSPTHLLELAVGMLERVPLCLEERSKADRGFSLVTGDRPGPLKSTPTGLTKDLTVAEAFPLVARNCLTHIRANEGPVREGGDPEGVHQMRVGVRRLRALVGLFHDALDPKFQAYLADGLRWLQQQLRPARDWDVFILETLDPILAHEANDVGMKTVVRRAVEARDEAYVCARETLDDPRMTALLLRTNLILETGAWANVSEAETLLDAPVTEFAHAMMARFHRRLCKLGDKHASLTEPELHKLRIRGKRMRYGAEFFSELYDRDAVRALLSALRDIQDRLGSLNDAVVARGLLAELKARTDKARNNRVATSRAFGAVEGWNFARIDRDLAQLPEVWNRYRAIKPYWG